MGNVGKRSGMHQGRRPFQGLHQVGLDGIFHQDGQRTGSAQVLSRHRFTLAIGPDHHPSQPFAHVTQVGGQRQDGHDLAGNGDVEACPAGFTLLFRSQPHFDLPQKAVIGIDHPPPGDRSRVDIQAGKTGALLSCQLVRIGFLDPQFLQTPQHGRREFPLSFFIRRAQCIEQLLIILLGFMEHAGIDGCCQQVVGGGDGMDVTGEMQVEILHRDDLRIPAPGSTTLDAKGRPL